MSVSISSELLEKIKTSLRVSAKSEKITEEIADLIEAGKQDLKLAGVNKISENDFLIIRALTLYCKANFGNNNKAEAYQKSYDMLKMSLTLAGDYKNVSE